MSNENYSTQMTPVAGTEAPIPAANAPPSSGTPEVSFEGHGEETVPMLDHDTKHIIQVPKSQIETALRTKRYVLPKGLDIPMINPETLEGGYFKSENVSATLDKGWKLENPEDTHKRVVNEKYGDSEFTAGIAGAARGLSFGLSDQLLTRTGAVKSETLAGLEEANPISSGIGEVAGFGLGLFGPGELGAGIKGVSALGKGAETATAKFLTKKAIAAGATEAVATSLGQKVIAASANLASKAAGGAVEGAFYGTGSLLSENALGKADFNAENLLGSISAGALVGGALGLAVGTASALAPGIKSLTGKVSKPIIEGLEGLTDKGKAATELLGMTKKEALRVEQTGLINELPEFFKNKLGLTKGMADDEIMARVQKIRNEAGDAIGVISEEVDAVGKGSTGKILAPEAAQVYDKIEKSVQESVLSKLDGTVAGQDAIKQIKNVLGDYETAFAGKDFLTAKEMLSEMRALDGKLQRFYRDPAAAKESIKALYEVRSVLREEINALADRAAASPGINPELGKNLRAANKDFYVTSTMQTPLERKLLAKSGFNLKDMGYAGFGVSHGAAGLIGSAIGKFVDSDLRRRMVILSGLEKSNLEFTKTIAASTKNFFSKTGQLAEKEILYKMSDSDLSRDEQGKKAKNEREAFLNVRDNLQRHTSNPQGLIDTVTAKTANMQDVAPETAAALAMSANNAVQFLNSKVPKSKQNQGLFDLLNEKKMPSSYDLSKFNRYLKAVEKPKSVIKAFGRGTASLESVEALKAVYPNMYEGLRNAVIQEVSANKTTMPYSSKIRLGILLDMPTDASLIPENVIALQGAFSTPENQGPSMVQPSVGGSKQLNLAERETTATQDVQSDGAGA